LTTRASSILSVISLKVSILRFSCILGFESTRMSLIRRMPSLIFAF
jgi:hypothetical protein